MQNIVKQYTIIMIDINISEKKNLRQYLKTIKA